MLTLLLWLIVIVGTIAISIIGVWTCGLALFMWASPKPRTKG